jgi:hypothetical protein
LDPRRALAAIRAMATAFAANPVRSVERAPNRRVRTAPPNEQMTAKIDCGTNSVP